VTPMRNRHCSGHVPPSREENPPGYHPDTPLRERSARQARVRLRKTGGDDRFLTAGRMGSPFTSPTPKATSTIATCLRK